MDCPARSQSFSQYFRHPPESFRFCNDEPEIGRGAYGSVHPGELDGRPVAVKRIHSLLQEARATQGKYIVQSFEQECRRMESLNHPRLVTFLGAYLDLGGPFLVMERMTQDLRQFLDENRGKLTLQKQLQLCLDIATGLHYLHSQETPLVHRDLNDKNILIDEDGRASIADLGQSQLKKHPHEYFNEKAPGAMVFMPPEALSQTPHYNEMVDIFSFGVLMLEIATQREPNPGLQGIGRDQEEERRKEDLDHLPEGHPLRQLILDCLQNDPHKRPCIKELCDSLQQLAKPTKLFRLAKDSLQGIVSQLQASLSNATTLANIAASSMLELLKTVESKVASAKGIVDRSEMKVVFFGRTSNGKSTLINALLKCQVLPTGDGSVTNCFCLIKGQSRTTEGGYIKLEDSDEELPVENALKLASYFDNCDEEKLDTASIDVKKLHPDSNLEIYWSTAQCPLLIGDIVLVDCPGLNASKDTDAKVIQHCSDADVFVYVANGRSTFEIGERKLLEEVALEVSKPSSTFVLFNQWDLVKKDRADRVKQQHLKKVDEILVQQLRVYTAEMVQKRTFFLSADKALTACNVSLPASPDEQLAVSSCQQEFERFQRMMQNCLLEAAIATKFGRHHQTSVEAIDTVQNALERMTEGWEDEQKKNEVEVRLKDSLLERIDAANMRLQQMFGEKIQCAVDEFSRGFDELHETVKHDMRAKVELFDGKEPNEKWEDYQTKLIEHLDEEMTEMMKPFEEEMKNLTTKMITPIQEELAKLTIYIDEPYELNSFSFEHDTCAEMTEGYRARPWFGRWLIHGTSSLWKTLAGHTDLFDTETIALKDEQHEVPQRPNHNLSNDFLATSFWVAMTTLAAPLGIPSVSIAAFAWAKEEDLGESFRMNQVKGKIIRRLTEEIDRRKTKVQIHCKDYLQRSLKSRHESFAAALTKKQEAVKAEKACLVQNIDDCHEWTKAAKNIQDQLQQVKPHLDHFYRLYLQGDLK